MTELVVATRNPGKVRELVPLVTARGWRVVTLDDVGVAPLEADEAVEDQPTFAGNALAKARHYAARSGMVVLADDSGLVVEALGGLPGARSKRWSGWLGADGAAQDAANVAHLLGALTAVGAEAAEVRGARFVCAAAAVWPGGEVVTEGEVRGRILAAPVGTEGFGYDPVFWSDELGLAFGEATREAKALVSHRGRAFRALLDQLATLWGGAARDGPGTGKRGDEYVAGVVDPGSPAC